MILHVDFAVKQDPELGQDWLRYVKAERPSMGPFALAVLLGMARLQRFEQPVLDLVKGVLLRCYRDQRQRQQHNWAARLSELDSLDTAHSCEPHPHPPSVIPQ